ncbi:neutral zinc metallopeptidase [soil metagenome]
MTACGEVSEVADRDNDTSFSDDPDDTTQPTAGQDLDDVEDRFVGDGMGEDDAVILAALQDVESYWEVEYPEVFGDEFEPVSGGLFAYGPDTDSPPCGSPHPSYEDIAANAFYCPPADLIAWDTDSLVPDLKAAFGDFTLGIVMAHEYAHAIQERASLFGLTITSEQQADCWAGSWTKWVADGNAANFSVTLADLDSALAGFLQLRDAVGTPAADPLAHGSAFDRIGAFQDGFINGAGECASYEDDNLDVVDIPFGSQADFDSGGNAPFDEVEGFSVSDLDGFWTTVFPAAFNQEWDPPEALALFPSDDDLPSCGSEPVTPDILAENAFYCAEDDFVAWDTEELMPELYEEVGDFAMSTVIGSQYSRAAQIKLGNVDGSLETNLQADCFTGSWVASSVLQDRGELNSETNPAGNAFILSPGDLDEAVIAFLRNGDAADDFEAGEGENGTAFLRLTSFRSGFVAALDRGDSQAGIDACLQNLAVDTDPGGGT